MATSKVDIGIQPGPYREYLLKFDFMTPELNWKNRDSYYTSHHNYYKFVFQHPQWNNDQ